MSDPREEHKSLPQETVETSDLQDQISRIAQSFRDKHGEDIRVSEYLFTADRLSWQVTQYGYIKKKHDREEYKGYLMIEPVDLPVALQLLDEIGMASLADKKALHFKWLLMTYPPIPMGEWLPYVNDPHNVGVYGQLDPTDPLVVIYANEPADIIHTLSQLASRPEWEMIEAHRRAAFTTLGQDAPLWGTDALRDATGREWRSLNFNQLPGSAEFQR